MNARKMWGVAALVFVSVFFFWLKFGVHSHQQLFAEASDNSPSAILHPVQTFTVSSAAVSMTDAFTQAGIAYYPEDQVTAFPDPSLHIGSVVTVHRALPVTVVDGKKSSVVRTWQGTVGDLLAEKKIDLGVDDKISPALTTPLTADTTITITRVARTTMKEMQAIDYQTIDQNDPTQYRGIVIVSQQGSDGQREIDHLLIRQDGELVSDTIIANTVIKPAVNKIVIHGTKLKIDSSKTAYGTASYYPTATSTHNVASHTLPIGTRVLITNSATGKTLEVTVNDYMAGSSHIIDLSPDLWLQVSNVPLSAGIFSVKVEVVLN